jgi:hypothetical protein
MVHFLSSPKRKIRFDLFRAGTLPALVFGRKTAEEQIHFRSGPLNGRSGLGVHNPFGQAATAFARRLGLDGASGPQ